MKEMSIAEKKSLYLVIQEAGDGASVPIAAYTASAAAEQHAQHAREENARLMDALQAISREGELFAQLNPIAVSQTPESKRQTLTRIAEKYTAKSTELAEKRQRVFEQRRYLQHAYPCEFAMYVVSEIKVFDAFTALR